MFALMRVEIRPKMDCFAIGVPSYWWVLWLSGERGDAVGTA
jgi:hypothetical protein